MKLIVTMAVSLMLAGPLFAEQGQGSNTVVCTQTNGSLVIDIQSPTGIGATLVDRPGTAWPTQVVARLHLRGLEEFKIKAGDEDMRVAVQSHGTMIVLQEHRSGTNEFVKVRSVKSPHRASVRIVTPPGTPAVLPLESGWFDVVIPQPMFMDKPSKLELRWVDFFR